MYTSLESSFSSSFIWHHNHDGRVTHDWAGTICTWYGTLTFVQGKWGNYAHVKNHNGPNVAAIRLFWTIGFLPVPLQIVCNRSCVIHWSCLWCHMKEENMSFPMMCTFNKKIISNYWVMYPKTWVLFFSGTPWICTHISWFKESKHNYRISPANITNVVSS